MGESRRYFGTDGIRGVAGEPPLTAGWVLRLGRAIGRRLPGTAVIVRDTRLSSPALRDALSAGLQAEGSDVVDAGVLPTPAIAGEVRRRGAAVGVAITASHNPWRDNGIKVFGPDGFKVDDGVERDLEDALEEVDPEAPGPPGGWTDDAGPARRAYLEHLRPDDRVGRGLRLVIDAANGAASPVAREALEASGAAVEAIHVSPDGRNINEGCGALHPEDLAARVSSGGADLGVALDGDADRCLLIGEDGAPIDGDVVIALLALHRGVSDVVGTVMTNEGVVRHLARHGVTLHRAPVGDRHVLRLMRSVGATLGGESSGHVIQLDRSPAGDGLATALAMLELRAAAARPLARLAAEVPRFPSRLRAVRVARKPPIDRVPRLVTAIEEAEERMGESGRVLVRYSGTEPVLRVFVEGADEPLVERLCADLSREARRALGDLED